MNWEELRANYVNGNITDTLHAIEDMDQKEFVKLFVEILGKIYDGISGVHSGDIVDALKIFRKMERRQ